MAEKPVLIRKTTTSKAVTRETARASTSKALGTESASASTSQYLDARSAQVYELSAQYSDAITRKNAEKRERGLNHAVNPEKSPLSIFSKTATFGSSI
ncbi:hypothetical protein ANAPH2_01249 [Anaplasma phagocytophilum]|nr:hypothetical protein ANAPH2_01249 [Anaplasma phagocytophilum]